MVLEGDTGVDSADRMEDVLSSQLKKLLHWLQLGG